MMTHHDLFRQLEKAMYGFLLIGAVIGLVLILSTLLSGCVAAGAAAGGAAGAAVSDKDEDVRDLEYWLKTNDHTDRIGTAMRREELTHGMSRTHVKLVMGAKSYYDSLPTEVSGDSLWVYEPELDRFDLYRLSFSEDSLTTISREPYQPDQKPSGRAPSSGGL